MYSLSDHCKDLCQKLGLYDSRHYKFNAASELEFICLMLTKAKARKQHHPLEDHPDLEFTYELLGQMMTMAQLLRDCYGCI